MQPALQPPPLPQDFKINGIPYVWGVQGGGGEGISDYFEPTFFLLSGPMVGTTRVGLGWVQPHT